MKHMQYVENRVFFKEYVLIQALENRIKCQHCEST